MGIHVAPQAKTNPLMREITINHFFLKETPTRIIHRKFVIIEVYQKRIISGHICQIKKNKSYLCTLIRHNNSVSAKYLYNSTIQIMYFFFANTKIRIIYDMSDRLL